MFCFRKLSHYILVIVFPSFGTKLCDMCSSLHAKLPSLTHLFPYVFRLYPSPFCFFPCCFFLPPFGSLSLLSLFLLSFFSFFCFFRFCSHFYHFFAVLMFLPLCLFVFLSLSLSLSALLSSSLGCMS